MSDRCLDDLPGRTILHFQVAAVADESVTICDFAGLAHLVEQLICNHQVAGSSPAAGTNKIKGLRDFHVAL